MVVLNFIFLFSKHLTVNKVCFPKLLFMYEIYGAPNLFFNYTANRYCCILLS